MQPQHHDDAAPIDPYDPARADKWGYTDEEIRRIIPGLEPIPGEEVSAVGPKYPQVQVRLIGTDGNCFNLLGLVLRALRQAGVSEVERDAFRQEATAGNYDNLLRVIMAWVDVT